MAMAWHHRWVRGVAASIRAVHELFWGLLLLQVAGLSTVTGVLAIAIPYAGIFAKVFGEFLEEADPAPAGALPASGQRLSVFFYARLPLVWQAFKAYGATGWNAPSAPPPSLVLSACPPWAFTWKPPFGKAATTRALPCCTCSLPSSLPCSGGCARRPIPVYLLAAIAWAPPLFTGRLDNLVRFVTVDLVPLPLRQGGGLMELWHWFAMLWQQQLWPGLWQTLVLGLGALLLTGLLSLLLFPLISPLFGNRASRTAGHGLLVVMRTTPEFFLAFFFLILLGPSMLPGILALALHTGAIVAHLTGRFSESLKLRADAPTGINRYAWEVLPRVTPNLLAFLLYRWEVIMRETAVLGILGIHTLGFYIDSSVAEFRFDRTLLLILATVMLNLAVDALSRGCASGCG